MQLAGKWLGKRRQKKDGVQKNYYYGVKLLSKGDQKLDNW
jgi:hypothetical protein